MAEVKWIKITTDIFDDEKILLIESLPDAYAIITVWFKLLCLAGKQNNSGVFLLGRMPYTDQMLSTIFRMKQTTVRLAIETFQQFGMIEVIDGVITIPNWDKHQSLDAYEKKKERDRLYQTERRAKQKALAEKSSDKSSDVAFSDKEKEKEEDKDKEHSLSESVAKRKRFTPPAPEKSCEDKKNYGTFENVMLSDDEYSKICEKYGKGTANELINSFSCKLKSKGYKSVNHCATIMQWAVEDGVKEKGSFDYDEFWESALARSYNEPITPRAAIEREAIQRSEEKAKNPPKTAADDPDIRTQMERLKERLNGA